MPNRSSTLTRLTAATLLLAAGTSHAAITVYTDQAAFLAAVSTPGVDTYLGFSITGSTPSPINRTAGPYSYTGSASSSSFFGAGTVADPWLSTNTATDTITLNAFPPAVFAAGGLFFGSNVSGAFQSGDITIVASDSNGAVATQTITAATQSSFRGFVSDFPLTSLTVQSVQPTTGFLWPTVDNLTLAIIALPDPIFSNGFE
jgi:hypothetical protein